MIELAPLPVAPPAAQETEAPPAPVKTEEAHPEEVKPPPDVTPPEPAPPETPPMVEPPPQAVAVPEAPLAPKPEAVLPKEVQKPVPPKPAPKVEKKIEKVTKPEHKPPAERTAAPKRVEAAPAPRAAAPAARPAGNPSVSSAEWGSMVRARIMAVKSCPGGASGASGAATVSFSISGGGALVGARVTGSSGSAALDAQAASMVRSASPYPPTPTGGTVSLSIPIRFGC
jgi:protein TonB